MTDYASYRNVLEPPAFVDLFTAFPPVSFSCRKNKFGQPVFFTDFDLLTTLHDEVALFLNKIPLSQYLSRLLRFATCFCGTTITEYIPQPKGVTPLDLVKHIKEEHAHQQSLLIIKDLPDDSPLLSEDDNAFAKAFANHAQERGFIKVQGQALAYVPIDFASEEEYLARLSSGRRKDLRRKLKKKTELLIEHVSLGDEIFYDNAFLKQLYDMYLAVYEQSNIHFDLLSPEFFATLLQNESIPGVVFLYRHEGILAAYNICLTHNFMLIDKYIGFNYPLARELNLYFISWLVNLDYARKHNFSTYIAGWTDPEVKASLGAKFTFTQHIVWIKNPLLRHILYRLKHLFEADSQIIENPS